MLRTKMFAALPLLAAALFSAQSPAATWTKLGGVPGGIFGRVAVDPGNPKTVFLGSEEAGLIFKSTDGGKSYTEITVGPPGEGFRAIAVDPADSKIVFAVGRGSLIHKEASVYESTDGGSHWAPIAHQPGGGKVLYGWDVLFDKTGGTILTADSFHGIFRSATQGAGWTHVLTEPVRALAADPNDAKTFWAAGHDLEKGVAATWTSTDAGKSWTKMPVTVLDASVKPVFFAIAVLPKSGKILAAWSGSGSTGTVGGVVASANGGKTWVNSSAGLPAHFDPGTAIAVDPTTPATLYLGTFRNMDSHGVYRSTDSGAHWKDLGIADTGGAGLSSLAARPAGNGLPAAVIAAGTGVFVTTDKGLSWSRAESGLNIDGLFKVTADPANAKGLYGATIDGIFHSTDSGQSWTRISNWKGLVAPLDFDLDLKANPATAKYSIYVAANNAVWQSRNGGRSWTSGQLPGAHDEIGAVLMDRAKTGRVYAHDGSHIIYRTDNAGADWTRLPVGKTGDAFTAYPIAMALDVGKTGTLYAAVTSGLLKSVDAGITWENTNAPVAKDDSIVKIVTPQTGSGVVIVGTQKGAMLRSENGGKTWKTIASPASADKGEYIQDLVGQPGTANLFAFDLTGTDSTASFRESRNLGNRWAPIKSSVLTGPDGVGAMSVTASKLFLLGFRASAGAAYWTPTIK